MKYRSVRYKGMKNYENTVEGEVDDLIWLVAQANGCIDADRCNGHTEPYGSCKDCLERADEIIKELSTKGYNIVKSKVNEA